MNVKIINGVHRGNKIEGTFEVFKPWQNGARGGYITVKAEVGNIFQTRTPRIMVEQGDFILLDADGKELSAQSVIVLNNGKATVETNYEEAFALSETEDEAKARIRHTFGMLDKVTESVTRGIIRGLVIVGPPGVGKSFGVEQQLTLNCPNTSEFGPIKPCFEIVSGGVSSVGLYQILWNNRNPGQVLCFDDSDEILADEESLNLLKAALNSGERRRICWNKESRILGSIPNAFDFHGSIVFLSNINFEGVRAGSKIADHLKAIVSRCHYMDLEIGSMRDRLLRIKQIVGDGMLDKFAFDNNEEQMIVDWVVENCNTLREVSLRMVIKIAELVAAHKTNWEEYAEATCLVREARFARLYARKQALVEVDNDAKALLATVGE